MWIDLKLKSVLNLDKVGKKTPDFIKYFQKMTSCKCYPNFIQIFWKTRFILILFNVNSKTSNVRSSNKVPSLPQQPQLAFLKSRFWNWDLLLQLLLQLPLRLLWMILSKAIETGIFLLITDIAPTYKPIQISYLNFKAVLALPKMAGSAQTHKFHLNCSEQSIYM